jgi:hypothetical protein
LTENGRLLADGPPARMTAAAIAESQADAVPLLYTFAVQAGQLRPPATDTETFPATDPHLQQTALIDNPINWPAVALVGEGYIDAQCDRFLTALNELERSKRGTLANLNAVQSATVGIMGLALAAQEAIGIVGIAFGLGSALIDNSTSVVLYQLPASSIRTIVKAQRDVLRQNEDGPNGVLAKITNQGLASARLGEYIQYCVPVTIEANVASVLNRTTGGPDGYIVTSATKAAVTSSLAPVISGIRPGTPIVSVSPTIPRPGSVIDQSVNGRLAAFARTIRTVNDLDTLKAVANALRIDQNIADPDVLRATIIREVDSRVRSGDPALANERMNAVSQVVSPIVNTTF